MEKILNLIEIIRVCAEQQGAAQVTGDKEKEAFAARECMLAIAALRSIVHRLSRGHFGWTYNPQHHTYWKDPACFTDPMEGSPEEPPITIEFSL